MTNVFKQLETIVESAKDFDTFLATQLSKKTEIEIVVSQRLSIIISEAEKILAQKLKDYENIVNKENKRLEELSQKLIQEQKTLASMNEVLNQDKNIFLDAVAKHSKFLQDYQEKFGRLKVDQEALKQKNEELALQDNSLRQREDNLSQQQKNIEQEKSDLKRLTEDLSKRQQVLQEKERIIETLEIDKKLKNIEQQKAGLEKQKRELEEEKAIFLKKEQDLQTRIKNANDKERNLDNYKLELEIAWGEFKRAVNDAKKKS